MSTMRAMVIENAGPNGVLALAELPVPAPAADEVRIRVSHAGINRADVFQRLGTYPAPEGASPIPGLEVSGVIDALGENVNGFEIGQAVCALTNGGGYAQFVCAPVGQVLPVPEGLSMAQAAALPEACMTVWMALVAEGGLRPGESVLIQGGTSGIGTTAISLLTHYGATVFATARTEEKCTMCRSLGAKDAFLYDDEELSKKLKAATADKGVDVALEMLGGSAIQASLNSLAPRGRMVSIAFLNGAKPALSLGALLLKQLTWKGVTLRSRSPQEKAQLTAELREKVWPALANGLWAPRMDEEFTLENAGKAHGHMEQRLHLGKIVLKV